MGAAGQFRLNRWAEACLWHLARVVADTVNGLHAVRSACTVGETFTFECLKARHCAWARALDRLNHGSGSHSKRQLWFTRRNMVCRTGQWSAVYITTGYARLPGLVKPSPRSVTSAKVF